MAYKTVLVHVDQSQESTTRVKLAAQIAKSHQAHLVGVAMTGISRYVFDHGAFDPKDPVFAHHLDHLHQHARASLLAFDKAAASVGVDEIEARLVDDDAAGGVTLHARYADIAVIGQFDPSAAVPGVMSNFAETVVLNSGRPVLVVPHAGQPHGEFTRALLAWDGGLAASRAITGALPLLKQAGTTDVLVLHTSDDADAHGEQPGVDLALYLARHGVRVNVIEHRMSGDAGEALLSAAADLGADLMVMGAYGHTRFREVILGGVTRTVLQSMTVPVLMAH
jgi:nucleotide-binding universal stress UspA family protein